MGLITSERVVFIDSRRGTHVETFRTRRELLEQLVHLADEDTLRWVEKEIVVAIEELHTGARLAGARPIMSTAIAGKRPIHVAMRDANEFRELFPSTCYEQWAVVGSCRRHCKAISDVEHLIIPRFGDVERDGGLFPITEHVNLLWERLEELVKAEQLTKHNYNGSLRWGEKYRGADFRGFNHELFMADADNWGSRIACLTGPAEFSRMLVSKLQYHGYMNHEGYVWNKKDWACACGWAGATPNKVKNPPGNIVVKFIADDDGRDGGPYACLCPICGYGHDLSPKRLSVPEETKYFELCGVRYIEPAAQG